MTGKRSASARESIAYRLVCLSVCLSNVSPSVFLKHSNILRDNAAIDIFTAS